VEGNSSLLKNFQMAPVPTKLHCSMGTRGGGFAEVKLPRREGNHSTPFTAEVKNGWSCTSAPPIGLHDVGTATFTCTVLTLDITPSELMGGSIP
jgi:hypothetical protein